jgi:fluoride ion exporter CrcB/FEX
MPWGTLVANVVATAAIFVVPFVPPLCKQQWLPMAVAQGFFGSLSTVSSLANEVRVAVLVARVLRMTVQNTITLFAHARMTMRKCSTHLAYVRRHCVPHM